MERVYLQEMVEIGTAQSQKPATELLVSQTASTSSSSCAHRGVSFPPFADDAHWASQ